jgi:hypothetical protein
MVANRSRIRPQRRFRLGAGNRVRIGTRICSGTHTGTEVRSETRFRFGTGV